MVIINDIYAFLNEIAPVRYQMDFDNAGFLVGDGGTAVKNALLALDITDAVIAEAIELRAQLIVSHHPLIFTPLRHATTDDLAGRKVLTMARHGISAICMHTNLDIATAASMMRSWRRWARRSRAAWSRPVRRPTGARLPADV